MARDSGLLKRVGHYELLDKLGEGGSGDVYRARDTRGRRDVALKILHPHKDEKDAARFQREVRLAAALRHPNVLAVHDWSPPGSPICFLVMELVEGGSLRQLAGRKLLPEEAAVLLLPAARALQAAHRAGIVHRDVKPDNILVDRGARGVVIKLTDFGVALATDEPRITADNSVSGSIAYMAPEQLRLREISPASDVWSLGITFFELIAGQHPFDRRRVGPLVQQVLSQEPRLALDAARPVVEVVHRCLQARPGQRLPDGGAVADAIADALRASGIDDPDRELQLWARDPSYSTGLEARLAAMPPRPRAPAPISSGEAQREPAGEVPRARWTSRDRLLLVGAALLGALAAGLLVLGAYLFTAR